MNHMDKLNMQTTNQVDENIKRIGELFPNCLTERLDENGRPETAIDFDLLRQELSKSIVEGPEERYQFTWPDKRNAIRLANAPTTDTLRPCREESVNFDTTQNLYIEGDNLQVLKLLRENYLGKVKMIYIDPPYNTGNDFVYNDDFAQSAGEYIHNSGQEDEEGNRLVANTESNGRFHTDWLNMIYPRLKVAKDLLREDGSIFISIDDNEVENLKRVCNEVFGERNFYAQIVWQKRTSPDARFNLGAAHDFILVYARNKEVLKTALNKEPLTTQRSSEYKNPDNDPRGPWASVDITGQTGHATSSQFYEITTKGGMKMRPPKGRCWALSEQTFLQLVADNRIWFGEDGNSRPRQKRFLSESEGVNAWTWWDNVSVGHNQEGTKDVKDLLGTGDLFTNPKPVRLLLRILRLATNKDSIVLDFFSGSATTAHAVLKLNAEDGGKRKFIMVQLPEETNEKSEARKYGYNTICEIGKMRIKCAGEDIVSSMQNYMKGWKAATDMAINDDQKKAKQLSLLDQEKETAKIEKSQLVLDNLKHRLESLDLGFRVLKLDSSNMQDVYYSPEQFNENLLFEDNIKPDRTEEDLLFQAMIELGIELSAKIEKQELAGKTVWSVANGYLMACFDTDVNETTITEIARQKPYYFVMRDSSLATDNVADNFEQIWEEYSKETIRRII